VIARTLSLRITVRFVTLVTLANIAALAIGGWLLNAQMRRSLVIIHQTEITELLQKLANASVDPQAVRDRILRDSRGDSALFMIQIHDHNGNVMFRSENLGESTLPDLPAGETQRAVMIEKRGEVLMTESRIGNWHIQVASSIAAENRLLHDYIRTSVVLVVFVALLSLGLGYGFSQILLKPLRMIARTARQIGADNLKSRIPLSEVRDELADLTNLLNAMFDRLEASFDQVRRFAGDVSHELKTPLAIMRLNADKLRVRVAGDPDAVAAVDDWLEEQARLVRVIERLLFLTRVEGGALLPKLKQIEPAVLLHAIAEDAAVLAEDKNIRFTLGPCPAGSLRGDAELLRQLLLNLVRNSLHVSSPGGRVEMSARQVDSGWELVVEDEGPGLPEDELERIFDRFVRYEKGTSSEQGHGLGLAICKSIAALHGGSIRAENRPDRSGLRVSTFLPA
jgi:signal transduction histidine kinase